MPSSPLSSVHGIQYTPANRFISGQSTKTFYILPFLFVSPLSLKSFAAHIRFDSDVQLFQELPHLQHLSRALGAFHRDIAGRHGQERESMQGQSTRSVHCGHWEMSPMLLNIHYLSWIVHVWIDCVTPSPQPSFPPSARHGPLQLLCSFNSCFLDALWMAGSMDSTRLRAL